LRDVGIVEGVDLTVPDNPVVTCRRASSRR
jgi:hypothetical protein